MSEVTAVDLSAAERLAFFSDAVVAIAITLLAIDLPVPVGGTDDELVAPLREGWFDYLGFLISFAMIANHWTLHHGGRGGEDLDRGRPRVLQCFPVSPDVTGSRNDYPELLGVLVATAMA